MDAVRRRRVFLSLERREPASPDSYLAEHQRLLDGDRAARESLAAALLYDLTPIVRRIVRWPDSGFVGSAVDDAILDYLRSPSRFQPPRGTLVNYLTTMAVRNVLDLKRAEARRRLAEERAASWWHWRLTGPTSDARDTLEGMLSACGDAADRAFARAWLEGASVDTLAALGRLSEAPGTARKTAVKRRIERLRLRCKRHLQRSMAARGRR